jgi:hypothetical protein
VPHWQRCGTCWMRYERVKLYDGEMTTGTTNSGGFTLTARLPLTGYRS